jgi:CheY-like chemotaxis protein
MSLRPVLYAEDEENDAFFLKRAFKQAQIPNPLVVLPDGQAAIDYVSGTGLFTDRSQYPLPELLLLDLKMPKKSGLEVLTWIRQEPALSYLPVIILTSSMQEDDISQAYHHGANAYLVKPSDPDALQVMVRAIQDFWLKQNRITKKSWNQ